MTIAQHIAKHMKEAHLGGSWTGVNLTQLLEDVNWQEATYSYRGLNSIALLTFHINYYVRLLIKVLQGGPLEGSDKYAFDLLPIENEKQWTALKNQVMEDQITYSELVEKLSNEELEMDFVESKYGTNFRNFVGCIEHFHYHLGQISILKKLIRTTS